MKNRVLSAILSITCLCTSFFVSALSAKADTIPNYPIDTSASGVHSFEAIDGTSLPSGYALVDKDGGKVKVAADKGNKYIKLIEANGGQARIQTAEKPSFGPFEFEFDFKIEDTNGPDNSKYTCRRIMLAESFMTGAFLLNLWTDASFENPFIRTTYKNTSNSDVNIDYQNVSYKLDTWYTFKGFVNPSKGCFTLTLSSELGEKETIVVTDANKVTSFGVMQLARIPSWAGYQNGEIIVCFDNFKAKTNPDIALKNPYPANDSSSVAPSSEISFGVAGNVVGSPLSFKLDGADIPVNQLTANSDGTYTYKPSEPFAWGTTHKFGVSVKEASGATYSPEDIGEVTFTIMPEPDNLIEVLGFCSSDGAILNELEQGEVNCNLRLWSKLPQEYTCFIALYKETNGVVKMVSANCSKVNSNGRTDKTIKVSVPEEFADCMVKVFVFDNFISRGLYYGDSLYGSNLLK